MKNLFINNINDLIEIQRISFYKFLYKGLTEELKLFKNPFYSTIKLINNQKLNILIYLYINKIKIKGPNYNIHKCIEKKLNYTINLYIACEYYYPLYNINKNNKKQIIFNFLNKYFLNFLKNYNKQILIKENLFLCEIPLMTDEGTFIINGCERIIINQMIRSPGIYFTKQISSLTFKNNYIATLISKYGLWTKFILSVDFYNNKYIYIKFNNKKNNKINIFNLMKYFNINFKEILDLFNYYNIILINNKKNLKYQTQVLYLENFYKNFKDYFILGEIGRYKLNKKLNLNILKNLTFLTLYDLIEIIKSLILLYEQSLIFDNIDDIKYKYIRSIGELLQNQFYIGINLIKKLFENKIKNLQLQIKYKKIQKIKKVFINSILLTKFIRDFFITSQLSQFMDQINPLAELTHKRRISVFGPNGLKRDNLNSAIRDINPSQFGRLCPIDTPEGQNAGLVNALSIYSRKNLLGFLETPYIFQNKKIIYLNKNPIYLDADQEYITKIGFNVKKNNHFLYTKKTNLISLDLLKKLNFLTISPNQLISIAIALIPFIEHDDSNRALMGANMQRQAVSLMYTQAPIIGTGLEVHTIINTRFIIKSYSEGVVIKASVFNIKIKDNNNQIINYYLEKFIKSNQNIALTQIPIVWPGEYIYSGQIIADGSSTKNGELALGKNLLIAYMPWEGFNYEDAIIINEKLLTNNILTSLHIYECETYIFPFEIITKNLPIFSSELIQNLDINGIVKIGSYVKKNDLLLSKMKLYKENINYISDEKLLIFNINKKNKNYVDTSLYVPYNIQGRIIDIRFEIKNIIYEQKKIICNLIRFYIAQIKKIQIGDKLAGRHGNKGIITRILPNNDMPYLLNGTSIDIIFNPLGVPSRMNVGQLFECLLGFSGYYLGKHFKIAIFDEIYKKEASRILINNKLKEVAIKKNLNWIYNKLYPGKILLKDGRTGEFFDNPIIIGNSYILKLIHLVSDKLQARMIGPYATITEQPIAGKSNKGGQRFGEMEIWALEAYGCSNTLQEFLTLKSDDINGRENLYNFLIKSNTLLTNLFSTIPESFLTLIRELNSLGLDFTLYTLTTLTKNPINLKKIENKIFEELEINLKLKFLEKNIEL